MCSLICWFARACAGGAGAPGGPTVQFVQGMGEVGHLTAGGVRSKDAQKRGGGTISEVPLLSVARRSSQRE